MGADGGVMARQHHDQLSGFAGSASSTSLRRIVLTSVARSRSSAPGGTRVAPWRAAHPAGPGTPGSARWRPARRSRPGVGPCTITRPPSGPVTRLTPGVIFSAAAAIRGSGNWVSIHHPAPTIYLA